MANQLIHAQGCDTRHTRRQKCNGPVVESARWIEREEIVTRASHDSGGELKADLAWRRFAVASELAVAVSMAVVWLGSRPDSVKYSDFTPLQILALLPPFGWLLRGGTGCGWGTLTWCLRLGLIYAAANMWARANDHQVVKIEDLGFFYHDYCCRTEWLLGMNIAMALAVAATLVSAYFLWRSQRSAIDQLGK